MRSCLPKGRGFDVRGDTHPYTPSGRHQGRLPAEITTTNCMPILRSEESSPSERPARATHQHGWRQRTGIIVLLPAPNVFWPRITKRSLQADRKKVLITEALSYGKHKSAMKEAPALLFTLSKGSCQRVAVILPCRTAPRDIPGVVIGPMGLVSQWTIDALGNAVQKSTDFRTTNPSSATTWHKPSRSAKGCKGASVAMCLRVRLQAIPPHIRGSTRESPSSDAHFDVQV